MKQVEQNNEEIDEKCGWVSFHPEILQKFRRPLCVLIFLCFASAVQGLVVNGLVSVVISTLERRYDLASTETGTIASCYDIASVICLIPISYFGGLGCKPRYLGIGILVMGIGSIVFALPHFTSGLYSVTEEKAVTCDASANTTETCTSRNSLRNYKYVFFLGQLLHGIGSTPLYTLGTAFIDENVPLIQSSFYLGIYYALAVIGPALGYVMGGVFLDVYVDINRVDPSSVNITSSSSIWVGAWWIGFIISAVLALVLAFPLCGFPSRLPGSSEYMKDREKEVYNRKGKATSENVNKNPLTLKQVFRSIKVLLTNPTFMFLNLSAACEGSLIAGSSTFAPKYIEEQYSVAASRAAQYIGFIVVPGGGGGSLLGGYLVKRFDLKVRGILRLCMGLTFFSLLAMLVFLVTCDEVPFAGVNIEYGKTTHNSTLRFLGEFKTSDCNANCSCSLEDYNPVCGVDGVLYYSPCYAGCQTSFRGTNPMEYHNCSCVNYEGNSTDHSYLAKSGRCDNTCKYLPVFLVVYFFVILFSFTASMPALSATLRCVPQQERSLALGIQWIIARSLGSIPGPIFFGKMIDITCLLWQSKCEEDGSCFFYKNRNMALNLLAISLGGKFLSLLFFVLALTFCNISLNDKVDEVSSSALETDDVTSSDSVLDKPSYLNDSLENINTGVQITAL